jgi:hypothetical protein
MKIKSHLKIGDRVLYRSGDRTHVGTVVNLLDGCPRWTRVKIDRVFVRETGRELATPPGWAMHDVLTAELFTVADVSEIRISA